MLRSCHLGQPDLLFSLEQFGFTPSPKHSLVLKMLEVKQSIWIIPSILHNFLVRKYIFLQDCLTISLEVNVYVFGHVKVYVWKTFLMRLPLLFSYISLVASTKD